MFALLKAADLNLLVQGGQLYRAFPFSKGQQTKINETKMSVDEMTLDEMSVGKMTR